MAMAVSALTWTGSALADAPGTEDDRAVRFAPESEPVPAPEAPEGPDEDAPKPERVWYGWTNMIVDAAGLAAGVTGVGLSILSVRASSGEPPLAVIVPLALTAVVGGLVLELGSPIVHLQHGHRLKAAASFLMRAGGTTILLGIPQEFGPRSLPVGVAILGAAIVVDDVWIAREDGKALPKKKEATFRVVPTIDMKRRGGVVGLSATF